MMKKSNLHTELFRQYPPGVRKKLLDLRALILDVASGIESVGPLEEAVRWGQLSFLTTESKSGTMIRIDRYKGSSDQYALYVHCQTGLVASFKKQFGDNLIFEGNRAVVFKCSEKLPKESVRRCIKMALTYKVKSANLLSQ